jgi:hypothetical protein
MFSDIMDKEKARQQQIKTELADLFENKEKMISQPWYFVKFSTFCRCDIAEEQYCPYFVLGEVGLVEYSLKAGITNEYHAFIRPNKIPVGYRSLCMDSSRDINKIPLDNFAHCQKTYREIYSQIESFLAPSRHNGSYTSVFCLSKDVEETRFGLKFLRDSSLVETKFDPSERVNDIESLFVHLMDSKIAILSAREKLTSYAFDYSSNTKCAYHDEQSTLHCALGAVKRFAYLISDSACALHNIPIMPKRHLPEEEPVGDVRASSVDFRDTSEMRRSKTREQYKKYESDVTRFGYDNDCSTYSSIDFGKAHVPSRQKVSDKFESQMNDSSRSTLTNSSNYRNQGQEVKYMGRSSNDRQFRDHNYQFDDDDNNDEDDENMSVSTTKTANAAGVRPNPSIVAPSTVSSTSTNSALGRGRGYNSARRN